MYVCYYLAIVCVLNVHISKAFYSMMTVIEWNIDTKNILQVISR